MRIVEDLIGISTSGDYGQWLGYQLDAEGDSLQELEENAVLWLIDQDGGEQGEIPLLDAEKDAREEGLAILRTRYAKQLSRGTP